IVAVVAVAAGVYFGVLNKGGSGDDPKVAQERADKILASFKEKGGEVTYKTAEAPGKGLVLKDVVVTRKDASGKPVTVNVGEVRINEYDWSNPKQPAFANAEYKAMRIPSIKESPQFKEFSSVTGLADVVINAKATYKYDQASKTVELSTGDFEVESMGTLSITAKFDGVDMAQLEALQGTPDPTKLMGLLAAARIHGLRIAFKDSGASAKVLKFGASKEKKSEDELRQQALAQIAAAKGAPFKIAREAGAAAETFIKTPGTFVIEAKPKAPFALAQLMTLMGKADPAAIDRLTDDLGLTVSAK
ncbi:MAG: hypothetical protein ACREIP_20715, partial [Alphaproteobacteria bacterium]